MKRVFLSVIAVVFIFNVKLSAADTIRLGEYKGILSGASTIKNFEDVQLKSEAMNCDYAVNIEFSDKKIGIPFAFITCKTPTTAIGPWNETLEFARNGNDLYRIKENGEIDTGAGVVGEVVNDNRAAIEITLSRKVVLKTTFITIPYCGLKVGINSFEYNLAKKIKINITKENDNIYTISREDYMERIPMIISGLPGPHEKNACEKIERLTSVEHLIQKEVRYLEGKVEKATN